MGIFLVILWMIFVPFGIGLLFTRGFENQEGKVLKSLVFGLLSYFAIFQVLSVGNMLTENNFFHVCSLFSYGTAMLSLLGYMITVIGRVKRKQPLANFRKMEKESREKRIESIVLWIIFAFLFVFQCIQMLRLSYSDGDDAFYVGTAVYGVNIEKMYSRIPYTMETTTFDTRHCLAPFPYVISFLSRMSGLSSASIAHSVFPILFLGFAYGIYYLIAKKLCKEMRESAFFMVLISVLFLFGNYSAYSMETFLMTRTRQGKAALGSFALPLCFYLMILFSEKLGDKKKTGKRERILIYILLVCNALTSALFTTLGNFIYPCMLACLSICICIRKKSFKKLFPLALSCMPSIVMVLLYFWIR